MRASLCVAVAAVLATLAVWAGLLTFSPGTKASTDATVTNARCLQADQTLGTRVQVAVKGRTEGHAQVVRALGGLEAARRHCALGRTTEGLANYQALDGMLSALEDTQPSPR